jgi:NADH-quinone oxidoreductase subunit N
LIITFFFATVPKIVLVVLFLKVFNALGVSFFFNLVLVLGIASIIYGTIIALYETKVMRLLAFASISHMGFLLIGLTQVSLSSMACVIFYLFMYIILVMNFFCILLNLRVHKGKKFSYIITLTDFCNIWKFDKVLAFCLAANVLSMAGIPPFGGFFMKFGIFLCCIIQHNYLLFWFLLCLSIINMVFYIRLIRFIFFESEKKSEIKFIKYEKGTNFLYFIIIALSFLNVFCFFYYPFLFTFLNSILI